MDRQIIKSDIIKQAKKVGSSLVLVKETTDSTIYYRKGDDPKNFDIIYDYVITFYGKYDFSKKLNMLGINIQTIPIEARSLFQRNTGVYVANVIINSKAFNANVLRGDVIVSINGIELLRPEDLDTLKNEKLAKTKTLTLKILRIVKGDLKEIEIPISF
jgi:C-terminal processing protease CtpA/Prc